MLLCVFEARLCLGIEIEIEVPQEGEKKQPKTQTVKAAY